MLRGRPAPLDANHAQVASGPMAAPPTLQPADARDRLGPGSRRDAWRWLFAAAAGLVLGAALSAVLEALAAWLAGTPGGARALTAMPKPPVWFVCASLIGLWAGFGAAAFVVTRSGRRVGLAFAAHDIWFLLVGMALQGLVSIAYQGIHISGSSKGTDQLLGGGTGWLLLVPAFMTIVLAPFFEELYFRGVLLRGLLGAWRTRLAFVGVAGSVVVDAALFGIAHLGTDEWVQLPGLIGLGVILCVLAIRTGRLGPSILTHAGFNLLAVAVFAGQR
jgi:membrane protease YdiL (CAAX protease family)